MKYAVTSVFFLGVILASQFYLYTQQKNQISELISHQERNHQQDRAQINSLASQHADERQEDRGQTGAIAEQLDAVQVSVGLMKTEYASTRAAQFKSLRDKLDAVLVSQSNESLQKLRNQIENIINTGALFQDHVLLAEEAFALGEKAKTEGDSNLAAIYYLSAINHAPSEYRFLTAYSDLVTSAPDPRSEDIARLRAVLQVSTYQVPPARIAELLSLSDEIAQFQPIKWGLALDNLKSAETIEGAWADSKRIAELVDSLADVAVSLSEEEKPDPELLQRAQAELELAQRVLRATLLASTLDTLTRSLEASMDQPEKAISLLQTAEAALGQLWGVDQPGLPDDLRSKMDEYPNTIKKYSEDVAKKQSEAPLNEIDVLMQQANELSKTKPANCENKICQERIDKIRGVADDIFLASKNVASVKGQEDVEAKLKELQKGLAKVQRWQFDCYQRWALEKMQHAFDRYKQRVRDPWDKISDGQAMRIYEEGELGTIDPRLLSPDVGQAFGDLLGRLLAPQKKNAFKMLSLGAKQSKKHLEDF